MHFFGFDEVTSVCLWSPLCGLNSLSTLKATVPQTGKEKHIYRLETGIST